MAELLAQHGKAAETPTGGGRRHRRRAPDDDDVDAELTTTAPQEIIDRIHAERPGVDWDAQRTNGHSMPGAPDMSLDTPTRATGKPPVPPASAPKPAKPLPPKPTLKPAPPAAAPPVAPPSGPPSGRWQLPAERKPVEPEPGLIADRLNGSRASMPAVTPAPPPPPPRRPMRAPEPMTDEFAVVEEDVEYEDDYLDDYESFEGAEYDDAQYEYDDELAEDEGQLLTHDEPAMDGAEEGERTPGQEWMQVGAQLALGVVGGAGVWLLFNWLWNSLPAIALALALVVTAGLVWIVRNIRKAEDMQSTVLAVLVGLVVTVSPAALLLLSR